MDNKKPSQAAGAVSSSLVVAPAAIAAIKAARAKAQATFGMRPDFSLVATALILEGAKSLHVDDSIRATVLQHFGLTPPTPEKAAVTESKPA